jgi:hypothetical protein
MKKLAPPLPHIELPFPQKLNPHNDEAWQQTLDWVVKFQLVPEKVMPYFRTLDYHFLSGYAFPGANLEQLLLSNKCMTLFNLFDQYWDDAKPEQIEAGQRMLLGALRGEPPAGEQSALELALRDMRSGMMKYSTPEWMARFTQSVEEYFYSCVWEAQNKKAHKIPDSASYIEMREKTGAVQPSVELSGVLGLVTIPPRLMEHPTIKRLNVLANHDITIFNDLISLEKEMRVGDVHNLVFVLKNEKKCSLEEAMQLTAKMHDDEVAAFVKLAGELAASWNDPEVKVSEVMEYVDVLQCWMRSNMDWSLFSERYHRLPPLPEAPAA